MTAATKKAKRPWWRWISGGLGILLLGWALQPLTAYVSGVGVVLPAALALVAIWWGFLAPIPPTKRKGWRRTLTIVFIVGLCLFLILGTVITVLMTGAATQPPTEDATLIVLGALVIGDQPSRMLKGRLDAAADYLTAHPDAHCIVSGGQGPNEDYAEAYVMKTYLVEKKGIDPARIAQEDQSTSTYENIQFSLPILEEKGWNPTLTVATQEFHHYRAKTLVNKLGGQWGGAVNCATPRYLLLNYWVRECAAICRLWLLGY